MLEVYPRLACKSVRLATCCRGHYIMLYCICLVFEVSDVLQGFGAADPPDVGARVQGERANERGVVQELASLMRAMRLESMAPQLLAGHSHDEGAGRGREVTESRGKGGLGGVRVLELLALGRVREEEAEKELRRVGLTVGARKRLDV